MVGGGTNSGTFQSPPDEGPILYGRVYLADHPKDEPPVGIVHLDTSKPVWIQHDGEWLALREDCGLIPVSHSEYKTDIAFDTFPVLPVDYREKRVWATKNQEKLHVLFLILSFVGLNMALIWPLQFFISIPGALLCATMVALILGRFEKWNWWKQIFGLRI